jgi:Ca-activated chloride channel family protein
VVYAGAAGLVLPPTEAADRATIRDAIDSLRAGGSTAGGAGIQLAYQQARRSFIEGGVNRVVLATDGDFNVGISDRSSLIKLIEKEARTGVFLTALGFGMGNLKDSQLEQLADNGNYAYIDSIREARKVLVEEAGGTLVTIAKDVKIQVEFNPAEVASYRLIGYENRALRDEDFNDDTKDAGEIGAGHTVTALYEIVPQGIRHPAPSVDPLKYQQPRYEPYGPTHSGNVLTEASGSGELFTVKIRWKEPDGNRSRLQELAVVDRGRSLSAASDDFCFAAAVAGFGMLLRDSDHSGDLTFQDVMALAENGMGRDRHGHRSGFLELVDQASSVKGHARRHASN